MTTFSEPPPTSTDDDSCQSRAGFSCGFVNLDREEFVEAFLRANSRPKVDRATSSPDELDAMDMMDEPIVLAQLIVTKGFDSAIFESRVILITDEEFLVENLKALQTLYSILGGDMMYQLFCETNKFFLNLFFQ